MIIWWDYSKGYTRKKKYKKDNFFFIGKHFPTLIDLVFYVLLNFPKNFQNEKRVFYIDIFSISLIIEQASAINFIFKYLINKMSSLYCSSLYIVNIYNKNYRWKSGNNLLKLNSAKLVINELLSMKRLQKGNFIINKSYFSLTQQ